MTAERLFGGFGVRILGKLIFRWLDSTLKIITCIAEAWSVETIDKLFGRSIYLSGFDPKRTLILLMSEIFKEWTVNGKSNHSRSAQRHFA